MFGLGLGWDRVMGGDSSLMGGETFLIGVWIRVRVTVWRIFTWAAAARSASS